MRRAAKDQERLITVTLPHMLNELEKSKHHELRMNWNDAL
jgi:hypothetical protein